MNSPYSKLYGYFKKSGFIHKEVCNGFAILRMLFRLSEAAQNIPHPQTLPSGLYINSANFVTNITLPKV